MFRLFILYLGGATWFKAWMAAPAYGRDQLGALLEGSVVHGIENWVQSITPQEGH